VNNHDKDLYGGSVIVDDDDDVIVVHDCAANNPCTPANAGSHFAHANPTKYISCDGQLCSEMQCAAGQIWNQNAAACLNQVVWTRVAQTLFYTWLYPSLSRTVRVDGRKPREADFHDDGYSHEVVAFLSSPKSVFCFTAVAPPLMTNRLTHSIRCVHLTRPTLRGKKRIVVIGLLLLTLTVVHRLLYMQLAHYKLTAIVTMILMTSILHTDLHIF